MIEQYREIEQEVRESGRDIRVRIELANNINLSNRAEFTGNVGLTNNPNTIRVGENEFNLRDWIIEELERQN